MLYCFIMCRIKIKFSYLILSLLTIKQHKSHAELQTKIAKKYRQKRRTIVVFDPTRILYKSENNPFYSYPPSVGVLLSQFLLFCGLVALYEINYFKVSILFQYINREINDLYLFSAQNWKIRVPKG
jgi:hypothetical protein